MIMTIVLLSVGAFFGMLVTSLCVASGQGNLQQENLRLKSELHKLQHEKATTPYPIEGAD